MAMKPGRQAPMLPQRYTLDPNLSQSPSVRPGLWHSCLMLTGQGDDAPQQTVQQRGQLRRARFSSAVMFGLLLLVITFIPLGLQDPTHATLAADVLLLGAIIVSAVLNRNRLTTAAGAVLVAILLLAIASAVLGAKQLDFVYLPAFDLLAIVILVAAAVS